MNEKKIDNANIYAEKEEDEIDKIKENNNKDEDMDKNS